MPLIPRHAGAPMCTSARYQKYDYWQPLYTALYPAPTQTLHFVHTGTDWSIYKCRS